MPLSGVREARKRFAQSRGGVAKYYFVLVSFMLPILISSFSNSNTAKHQVFFVFCFVALSCIKFKDEAAVGR
ncbi:hypothetical protein D3C81_2226420 [compost metagenome]